jgi:hypothetical protein
MPAMIILFDKKFPWSHLHQVSADHCRQHQTQLSHIVNPYVFEVWGRTSYILFFLMEHLTFLLGYKLEFLSKKWHGTTIQPPITSVSARILIFFFLSGITCIYARQIISLEFATRSTANRTPMPQSTSLQETTKLTFQKRRWQTGLRLQWFWWDPDNFTILCVNQHVVFPHCGLLRTKEAIMYIKRFHANKLQFHSSWDFGSYPDMFIENDTQVSQNHGA